MRPLVVKVVLQTLAVGRLLLTSLMMMLMDGLEMMLR